MESAISYNSLSDIPLPDALVAAYNARIHAVPLDIYHTPLDKTLLKELSYNFGRTERTLEILLRDLRFRRNSVMPITSRLPVEILSVIFELVAISETPHAPVDVSLQKRTLFEANVYDTQTEACDQRLWNEATASGSLGWIRLMHVCRQWRDVLCGMQALWSGIPGRLPLGIDTILHRAGQHSPLTVFSVSTPFHDFPGDGIFHTLGKQYSSPSGQLTHYARVRAIHHIQVDMTERWERNLSALLSAELESLETLEIQRIPFIISGSVTLSKQPINAPRLTEVRLHGCFLPWESNALSSLSLAKIQTMTMPAAALHALLQRVSSSLEFLELIHVGATKSFDGPEPNIDLSALRRLCFETAEGKFGPLLRRLKLPPCAQLQLRLSMGVFDGMDVEELEAQDVQYDVEEALECAHLSPAETCSTGLVITVGETTDTLVLCMHCDALNAMHRAGIADPLSPIDARLQMVLTNGMGDSDEPYHDLCLRTLSRPLDAAHIAAVSVDMPFWTYSQIDGGMSFFTGLRALRVVDPLEYMKYMPLSMDGVASREPDHFPFLSARCTASAAPLPAPTDDGWVAGSSPFELLWLVQKETQRYSCASWCNVILKQLRHTLCESGVDRPMSKPIKVLRVDWLADIYDEERDAHTVFTELAEVVEWRMA